MGLDFGQLLLYNSPQISVAYQNIIFYTLRPVGWQQLGLLRLGWDLRLLVRFRSSPWTVILGPRLKGQLPVAYSSHSQLLGCKRASPPSELIHSFWWPSLLIVHWLIQVTLLNSKSRGRNVHSTHPEAMVSSVTWREWRPGKSSQPHFSLTLRSSPKPFAICFSLTFSTFLSLLCLTHCILLTLFCTPFRSNDGAGCLALLSLHPCRCLLLTVSFLSLPFLYLPALTHLRVFPSLGHQCKCHLLQDWMSCSFSALSQLQHLIASAFSTRYCFFLM